MNSFEYSDICLLNLQQMPVDGIALSDRDRAQASRWSKIGFGEAQQWRIYQNGLAALGARQWLQENGVEVSIDYAHSSLSNAVTANLLNAVAPLKVGDYRIAICIQPDAWIDECRSIPRMLQLYSPLFAHLYLWASISEEQGWVSIESGLWQRDVIEHGAAVSSPEWETNLPIDADAPMNIDHILLALRCAQPQQLEIATSTAVGSALTAEQSIDLSFERLKQKLANWSDLSISSEILTLQESLDILRSPQLSEQFTQILSQKFNATLLSNLIPMGINVGKWLVNSADLTLDELGWVSVPALSTAMRSPNITSPDLWARLHQQGIVIPNQAETRSHTLLLGNQALQLLATVWSLKENDNDLAWTLLLILCSQPGQSLTELVQLKVRDIDQHLATETLQPGVDQSCSFIQVSGKNQEQFWVTLSLPNQPQMSMTLPPFFYES
ncbi:MAG: DUF1822 family protein [Cyanobacteria bacterium P01_F01_bin.42]